MRIPPGIIQDDALFRFLRAQGLLVRIAMNQTFLVRLDQPVPALKVDPDEPSIIRFGGYRRLAIRRLSSGRLEVGYLHGRRADLLDAVWVSQSARDLESMRDIEEVREAIAQR